MKAHELQPVHAALSALMSIKLPVKAAYRVNKAIRQIGGAAKQVFKQQQVLFMEKGTLSEDGKQYLAPTEEPDKAEFEAAYLKIMKADVEILFHPLSIADLGDVQIEPAVLQALDGIMIVDTTLDNSKSIQ